MEKLIKRIREEYAGAMVENVIIMPFIFIVIFSLILTAFIVHDRTTIEAAAQRGAIFASHCILDPNYTKLTSMNGDLDISQEASIGFTGVGNNIDAYRYIMGKPKIESLVRGEVEKIANKTRINWRPQGDVEVDCSQKNMFLYQSITVSVTGDYSIPKFFSLIGMETDYEYTAVAKINATDPDEFIRNADLIVDIVTDIDNKTGGYLDKAASKIGELGEKILAWLPDF